MVIVKGVDFPENCSCCRFRGWTSCVALGGACGKYSPDAHIENYSTRLPNCPLVKIDIPYKPNGKTYSGDNLSGTELTLLGKAYMGYLNNQNNFRLIN